MSQRQDKGPCQGFKHEFQITTTVGSVPRPCVRPSRRIFRGRVSVCLESQNTRANRFLTVATRQQGKLGIYTVNNFGSKRCPLLQ